MKALNRYILHRKPDLKKYMDVIDGVTIYQAGQYGSEFANIIQHTQLAAVPKEEKFLKAGDFVYMSHLYAANMYRMVTKDAEYASIPKAVWTADYDVQIDKRLNLPTALFALRGKKIKALYEVSVCDKMYKSKDDMLDIEGKRYEGRAKVIDSKEHKKGTIVAYLKNADYEIKMGAIELLCIPERWIFATIDKDSGAYNTKKGFNIVKALDEGESWDKTRDGMYLQLKDMEDRGFGEVVDGKYKGKMVMFKKLSPLELTENESHLYVCRDSQIYCEL